MVAFIEAGQRGTTERITKSWCRGIIPMQPLVSHHADQGSGTPTRFCLAISRCMVLWWRGATSSATGQKKNGFEKKEKDFLRAEQMNSWLLAMSVFRKRKGMEIGMEEVPSGGYALWGRRNGQKRRPQRERREQNCFLDGRRKRWKKENKCDWMHSLF